MAKLWQELPVVEDKKRLSPSERTAPASGYVGRSLRDPELVNGNTASAIELEETFQSKKKEAPRRGIEPRSTTRQAVILATKLSRMISDYFLIGTILPNLEV